MGGMGERSSEKQSSSNCFSVGPRSVTSSDNVIPEECAGMLIENSAESIPRSSLVSESGVGELTSLAGSYPILIPNSADGHSRKYYDSTKKAQLMHSPPASCMSYQSRMSHNSGMSISSDAFTRAAMPKAFGI